MISPTPNASDEKQLFPVALDRGRRTRKIATVLGIVGGAWGFLTELLLAVSVLFLSVLFLSFPNAPIQILLVTTVIGVLSGVIGGLITRKNAKIGAPILIGGASVALLGWTFQEGRTPLSELTSPSPVTVFFLGWIALVMAGGLLALWTAIAPTREREPSQLVPGETLQ